jgi:hypothetical protein
MKIQSMQMSQTDQQKRRCPVNQIENAANDESIYVGAGGRLIIPREDFGEDYDDGEDADTEPGIKLRRMDRREWCAINRESEFTVQMLLHKPKDDQLSYDFYYVEKALRKRIASEMKIVRIFQFYSFKKNRVDLYDVPVTPDNSWYESKNMLLKQPVEFFKGNMIKIISDRDRSRVRVRFKLFEKEISWPTTPMEELLGEALGQENSSGMLLILSIKI